MSDDFIISIMAKNPRVVKDYKKTLETMPCTLWAYCVGRLGFLKLKVSVATQLRQMKQGDKP